MLKQKIEEQAAIGREIMDGRFIISTGSPATPGTPIEKLRSFIDIGRKA